MPNQIELKDGTCLVLKTRDLVVKADDDAPLIAQVSDAIEDDEGDIIHVGASAKGQGWRLVKFNSAPLLLWQHDRWTPNLSVAGTRAYEDTGKQALLLEAHHDMGDPLAAHIDGKIRRGSIRETSVGFRGKVFEPREGGRGIEFWEQELIEVSWVNRGMNPRTDVLAKSIMKHRPDMTALFEDGGDPEINELRDEMVALGERVRTLEGMIAKIGDQTARGEEVKQRHEDALREWDEVATMALKRLEQVGLSK